MQGSHGTGTLEPRHSVIVGIFPSELYPLVLQSEDQLHEEDMVYKIVESGMNISSGYHKLKDYVLIPS